MIKFLVEHSTKHRVCGQTSMEMLVKYLPQVILPGLNLGTWYRTSVQALCAAQWVLHAGAQNSRKKTFDAVSSSTDGEW
jgi:hypothetical protein